jgi:hypothetical protein
MIELRFFTVHLLDNYRLVKLHLWKSVSAKMAREKNYSRIVSHSGHSAPFSAFSAILGILSHSQHSQPFSAFSAILGILRHSRHSQPLLAF